MPSTLSRFFWIKFPCISPHETAVTFLRAQKNPMMGLQLFAKNTFLMSTLIILVVFIAIRNLHLYLEREEFSHDQTERLKSIHSIVHDSKSNEDSGVVNRCQTGLKGAECNVRLSEYCAQAVPSGAEIRSTSAGSLGSAGSPLVFEWEKDFELTHLTATIRHGDRTAIHSMPGASQSSSVPASATTPSSRLLDPRAVAYAPHISTAFRVVPLYTNTNSAAKPSATEDATAAGYLSALHQDTE